MSELKEFLQILDDEFDACEMMWRGMTFSLADVKDVFRSATEKFDKLHNKKECVETAIQDALYATGQFTTDECTTLASGIMQYIKDVQ